VGDLAVEKEKTVVFVGEIGLVLQAPLGLDKEKENHQDNRRNVGHN